MFGNSPTLLDLNFKDAYKPETLPKDSVQLLKITNVRQKVDEEGNLTSIIITLESTQNQRAKDVMHFLSYPLPSTRQKTRDAMTWHIVEFGKAFGITPDQLPFVDKWIGKTGKAIVCLDSDPRYGEQNRISSLVLPEDK